jgi:hypothetical protein
MNKEIAKALCELENSVGCVNGNNTYVEFNCDKETENEVVLTADCGAFEIKAESSFWDIKFNGDGFELRVYESGIIVEVYNVNAILVVMPNF